MPHGQVRSQCAQAHVVRSGLMQREELERLGFKDSPVRTVDRPQHKVLADGDEQLPALALLPSYRRKMNAANKAKAGEHVYSCFYVSLFFACVFFLVLFSLVQQVQPKVQTQHLRLARHEPVEVSCGCEVACSPRANVSQLVLRARELDALLH